MMQLEGFYAGEACELARVSRAGFYRHYEEHEPRQADIALRDQLQKILLARGWTGPEALTYPADWHYVAEAWSFRRAERCVNLYFVADYGTGFTGPRSVESVAARVVAENREHDLWLHRTRDAKWKASVIEWADAISPNA